VIAARLENRQVQIAAFVPTLGGFAGRRRRQVGERCARCSAAAHPCRQSAGRLTQYPCGGRTAGAWRCALRCSRKRGPGRDDELARDGTDPWFVGTRTTARISGATPSARRARLNMVRAVSRLRNRGHVVAALDRFGQSSLRALACLSGHGLRRGLGLHDAPHTRPFHCPRTLAGWRLRRLLTEDSTSGCRRIISSIDAPGVPEALTIIDNAEIYSQPSNCCLRRRPTSCARSLSRGCKPTPFIGRAPLIP